MPDNNTLTNPEGFPAILKYPDTLGREFTVQSGRGFSEGGLGPDKQTNNQEPYVMFLPYRRPVGFSHLASSQGADRSVDVFASVPEAAKEYIVLPLPSSALNTRLEASYGSVDLKQIPAFAGTISGAVKSFMEIGGHAAGGDLGAAASLLADVSKNVGGGLASQAGMGLFKSLSDILPEAAAAASGAVGYVENPFTETMFERVRFRDHAFEYEFTPKTEKEAETIDRVIQRFKFHMLPDLANFSSIGQAVVGGNTNEQGKTNGLVLSFPYQFIIRYSVESTTFRLMPSVLTAVTVNYGGQDRAPSFYRSSNQGKNWPSRINLRLEFQEIIFLTRSRVATDEKSYTSKNGSVRYRF